MLCQQAQVQPVAKLVFLRQVRHFLMDLSSFTKFSTPRVVFACRCSQESQRSNDSSTQESPSDDKAGHETLSQQQTGSTGLRY